MQHLWRRMRSLLTRQEFVGSDKLGNEYYRWTETIRGEVVERRRVLVPGASHLYDSRNLPGPWRMWLSKTRAEPPTEQEIEECASGCRAGGCANVLLLN